MPFLAYLDIVIAAINFLFAFFVFTKLPAGSSSRIRFFIFGLIAGFFVFSNFLIFAGDTTFWSRMAYGLGTLVVMTWTYWFWGFYAVRIWKWALVLVMSLSFLFFLLSSFTPLIFVKITWAGIGIKITPGPLFEFYNLFMSCMIAYVLIMSVSEYLKTKNPIKKKQLLWVNIATFIFAGVAALVSFILPMMGYSELTNIDAPFSVFYMGALTFSMVRYRFMEIDTVVHRTVLWALTLFFLILPVCLIIALSLPYLTLIPFALRVVCLTAIFILFIPLYQRIKPGIDHIFRRRKYDYYRILGELGEKLGTELDISLIIKRLFRELSDIIYVQNGIFLLRDPDQEDFIETGSISNEGPVREKDGDKIRLKSDGAVIRWIENAKKVLERIQVEVNPKFQSMREEILSWMNRHRLELLIPVVLKDKVTGLIGIGKKGNLKPYTLMDVELLEKMGRQMGIPVDNALHHQDIIEKERIAEELRLGQKIQTGLLPQAVPDVPRLVLQGFMNPAREIGGDYYDFITLPDREKFGITIGDVSGKGVAAGLCMAMVKTAIHIISQKESSPKRILLDTNDLLNRHIGGEKFMTLLYLIWDSRESGITYSSAGHEHILVFRRVKNEVETILSGGIILGVKQEIESVLEEKKIILSAGDKILLYTDGVTEALNASQERFGLERLQEVFRKHSRQSVPDMIGAVRREIYSFIGNHPQYDDITLVAMEAR